MKTYRLAAAALAALPVVAFAYGERDATYNSAPVSRSSCGSNFTLLGDQGLLVPLGGTQVLRLRADGSIDTSWGVNGLTQLPQVVSSFYDQTRGFPLANGGYLVAGGYAAARLLSNGAVDATYGTNGVSDGVGGQFGAIYSNAPGADGSIVYALPGGNGTSWNFKRLDPNGRLDTSFGTNGVMNVSTGTGTMYAWGLRRDGSLEFATMQRQADGTLRAELHRVPNDLSAAERAEGRLVPRDAVAQWAMPGVRVDAQGRLLIGFATTNATEGPGFTVSRFTALGLPDASFGSGGTAIVPMGSGNGTSAQAINIGANGSITLAVSREGFLPFGGRFYRQFAYRLTDSGASDPSFPQGFQFPKSDTSPAPLAIDDAGRVYMANTGDAGCQVMRFAGDGPRSDARLVEYRYNERYFITAEGPESALLDSDPAAEKLRRTGQSFGGWLPGAQIPASLPLCRFNGDRSAGPVGHFYSLQGAECSAVIADDQRLSPGTRTWRFEGLAFNEAPTAPNGACPANLQPVYRLYNNAATRGGDPNHRFTTDPAVIAEMQGKGWSLEGAAFCAPPVTR